VVEMAMIKQQQYQHESNTWERLLDFFRQENAFLKNRLSEVLDSREDRDFLSTAEHFQNEFLLKDDYLNELRKDIKEQQRQIKLSIQTGEEINGKLLKKHEKLRNEIRYFEKGFSDLKNEFNTSLSAL
jgi:seryl-tRNA synthetase